MDASFLKNFIPGTLWMLLVATATFVVGAVWFPPPVRQPVSFDHQKHKELGCTYCHTGVETGARAGLPEIGVCLDCHDSAPVKDTAEIETWNRAVENKRIRWLKIVNVRNHVYFSHQRHVVLAKLECVTCHGDMADRVTPPPHPLKPVTMEVCMDCHSAKRVSNDCAICHK